MISKYKVQATVITLLAFALGFKPAMASLEMPDRINANTGYEHNTSYTAQENDHAGFEELQQDFESGPEVTRACLDCHSDIGDEIQQSHHWTWNCPSARKNKHGKLGYTLNNSSISPLPNQFGCFKCHISYRWEDPDLPLGSAENIDCLVCHEQTNGLYNDYRKNWNPDLNKVAQNVGRPSKRNCGFCHFYRSGGDCAMRGDLDSRLLNASRDYDVHMAKNGPDFTCTDCHVTENHTISGRCYENPATVSTAEGQERFDCTVCHENNPHPPLSKLNDHTDRVACETCHIPSISRDLHSRVWVDYSKAGIRKDGQIINTVDAQGRKKYSSRSGEWRWAKDVQPEYFWFTGGFFYTLATDKIDPSKNVTINRTNTDHTNPQSKIYPFKVFRAKQPYDTVNNTFVLPKFTGKQSDSGAYWIDYDWNKAIGSGMAEAGLPYSGQYDFVETQYLYPIHHTVPPKEKALKCGGCHVDKNGRLENLNGFYMPGRDRSKLVDVVGALCIIVALCFSIIHVFVARRAQRDKGAD